MWPFLTYPLEIKQHHFSCIYKLQMSQSKVDPDRRGRDTETYLSMEGVSTTDFNSAHFCHLHCRQLENRHYDLESWFDSEFGTLLRVKNSVCWHWLKSVLSRMLAFFLLKLSVKKVISSFIYNLYRIKTIPDQKGNNINFLEMPSHKINLILTYGSVRNFKFWQLLLASIYLTFHYEVN